MVKPSFYKTWWRRVSEVEALQSLDEKLAYAAQTQSTTLSKFVVRKRTGQPSLKQTISAFIRPDEMERLASAAVIEGFVAAVSTLTGERVIGRVHHVDIATQGCPPRTRRVSLVSSKMSMSAMPNCSGKSSVSPTASMAPNAGFKSPRQGMRRERDFACSIIFWRSSRWSGARPSRD